VTRGNGDAEKGKYGEEVDKSYRRVVTWPYSLKTLEILYDFRFLKKATVMPCISFLRKASAEISPFPPLKKGGGGGI